MTTRLEDAPLVTNDGTDEGYWHVTCDCNLDIALCGLELTGSEIVDFHSVETECVVCEDLENMPCLRCGE